MNSDVDPIHISEAEQYPCPWCSGHSGFASVNPNTLEGWFKNVGISMVRTLVNPKKHFTLGFTISMTGECLNCHRRVSICPYCDHPNRNMGLFPSCSNCGKEYEGTPV
jgi:hypothetical protein